MPEKRMSSRNDLLEYMTTSSGPARDAAFLRIYADKVENGTAGLWEIESIVRATLLAIVQRTHHVERG